MAMMRISKQSLSTLLFASVLAGSGYIAAQRSPTQQTQRTNAAQARPGQQNNDLRDEVTQLQTQVKDLQTAVADLQAEQKKTAASAKENHDLVLDTRIAQTQSREQLNLLSKAVERDERQLAEIGQQLSRMSLDIGRVKTKLGLY